MQLFGDASPEFFRLLDRFAIDALVFFETLDVCLLAEMIRTLEFSLLIESGIDVDGGRLCHAVLPGWACCNLQIVPWNAVGFAKEDL